MSLKKKNRFKPIFKKFIKLRENNQNRQKVLNFKKKKWELFLKLYLKNRLKSYRKFKPIDQSQYKVAKRGYRILGYKKRFRDALNIGNRLRNFYGNLRKNYFKTKIKLVFNQKALKLNTENAFLHLFESRLDTVLYRSKFAPTMRSAQQLILHGKVYVNQTQIKSKAYNLKNGRAAGTSNGNELQERATGIN